MSVSRKKFVSGRARQRGAGLIEVMVAVLILGIGLLGVAAMQATALRNSQSALERSQAVMQTYAILDAMRVNLPVARIGGYNLTTMTCTAPSPGNLAANDLNYWITSLQQNLDQSACGQIVCSSVDCEIRVQWDDSRGSGATGSTEEADGTDLKTVITRTKL